MMATEKEIMEFLEIEPTPDSAGLASFVTPGNDIPAKREKLAVLVSTGKAKEVVGAQLTHDQVKRLSDKEVENYHKRQEAYIGSKTTESLIDSLLMLFSKGLGMVVKIDDIEKLQQDLKNDYIINHELSSLAGGVALSCGRWLALANAALITTKHVQLETEPGSDLKEPATHPSRDKEGYPLEGIDEVKPDRNFAGTLQDSNT